MKKALNIIFGIIMLVSICLSAYLLYKQHNLQPPEKLEIHDTVLIRKDSLITKVLYKTKFDTCFIIQKDSVFDTVYVLIPIEFKMDSFSLFKDSFQLNLQIYYHGYKSSIDSIKTAYKLDYTLPEPKEKKFGWCITFGPSISYGINLNTQNKTFNTGPEIGFSIVIGPSYIIK